MNNNPGIRLIRHLYDLALGRNGVGARGKTC